MANGHVNYTYRPNTWLPPTSGDVQILLTNSEPSTHRTFRVLAAGSVGRPSAITIVHNPTGNSFS
jgi:hypothetical protein